MNSWETLLLEDVALAIEKFLICCCAQAISEAKLINDAMAFNNTDGRTCMALVKWLQGCVVGYFCCISSFTAAAQRTTIRGIAFIAFAV